MAEYNERYSTQAPRQYQTQIPQPPTGGITGGQQPPVMQSPAAAPQQSPFNYQGFKTWQGGWGGGTPEQLRQWVESNPFGKGYASITGTHGDKIKLTGLQGGDQIIDAIIGASKGGTKFGWTASGGAAGGGYGAAGAGGPGGAGSMTIAGGPVNRPGLPGKWEDLYKELFDRSHQTLKMDRNDPVIRQQADAFSAQQERARRNFLSDLAERGSPYGTGAQLGQQRMTAEHMGQQLGQFEAELMGRELETRRQEITHALDSRRAMLDENFRLALQKELALINDATQRHAINTGAQTSRDRLGFDIGQFEADYYLRSLGL